MAEAIEFFLDDGFNLAITPTDKGQVGPWMQIGRDRESGRLSVFIYTAGGNPAAMASIELVDSS